MALLQINGLTASAMFLRGTFEKLDIRPNFTSAGRFKSGVEQYSRTEMSPPAREALSAMLDDVFTNLVDTLASARGLSPDSVSRLFDTGPFGAPQAKALGLIDSVLYAEDVDSLALRRAGSSSDRIGLFRYADRVAWDAGPKIALIAATGTIVPGRSRFQAGEGAVMGAETMVQALREARTRRSIQAVVLRIDSPGGVIDAADDIWREVKRCRETKPVYVSMSDVAASGGYYIAAPATGIVAQPSTITGSIGVYSGKLNLLGLYRKLGLNVETVSRGLHAEMLSPFSDFTPEEAAIHQRNVNASYETFLDRVCEGRGLTRDEADSVGQGRVWSGTSAYAIGLVDTLGGMDLAFDLAREAADIDPDDGYSVELLPHVQRTFLDRVVEQWLSESDDDDIETRIPAVLRTWLAAARFPAGRILAVLPWSIEIR
jgi:protease-4